MFKFNRSTKSLTRSTVSSDVPKEHPYGETDDHAPTTCGGVTPAKSENTTVRGEESDIPHARARVRIRIIIDVSTLNLNANDTCNNSFDSVTTVTRRVAARILSSPWISDYLSRKLRGRGDGDGDEGTRVYVEIQPVAFANRESKESHSNGQSMELAEPTTSAASSQQRPSWFLMTTPSDSAASSAPASAPASERSPTPTILLLPLKSPKHTALLTNKKGIASLVLSSAWSFVLQSRDPWMGGENTADPHKCAKSQSRPHHSLLVVASEDAAFANVVAGRARGWWPFTREGDRIMDTVSVHLMPATAEGVEGDDFAMLHEIPASFECSYSVGSPLQEEWELRPLRTRPAYWGALLRREREDGKKLKTNDLTTSEKRSNLSAKGNADETSVSKDSTRCIIERGRLPQIVIAVDCAQFAKLSDEHSPHTIAKRVIERCSEIVKSVLSTSQGRDGANKDQRLGAQTPQPTNSAVSLSLSVEMALFDTVSARGDSVMPTLMAFETAACDLGPQRFEIIMDDDANEGEFVFRTSRALSRLRIAGTESAASRVSCGGGSFFQQAVVDAELMCYLAEKLIFSSVELAQLSSVVPSNNTSGEHTGGNVRVPTLQQHFILASGDGDFVETVRYLLSTEGSLAVSGGTLTPCNRSCSVLYLKASASSAWCKREHLSLFPL